MTSEALWTQPMYHETVGLVLAFLIIVYISLSLFFRSKRPSTWASIKSWLLAAPLLLLVIGLPYPWPLAFLVLVSIYASKTFFRMVGMYHRSWFVLTVYAFIFALGYLIHTGHEQLYNIAPMICLVALTAIPSLRNSAKHMIQYVALSLLAFIFFGWAFLHLGRLMTLENGYYMVIYIFILTEFCESVAHISTRTIGKIKLFDRISTRVTVEGIFISIFFTLLLAWGLRHMLPHRSEEFWIASALVAWVFGRSGDLFINVIRRDLGIKESGVFIIGRDDILARVDKLVFVAPVYFYTIKFLNDYFPS